MDYNLLFRWFVGLNADDEVWDATTFTKNRDRLLEADVAQEFLARVGSASARKGADLRRTFHGGRHAADLCLRRHGSEHVKLLWILSERPK
jgi:IS5 family transposase